MQVIAPSRFDQFVNERGIIASERINRFHEQLANKVNDVVSTSSSNSPAYRAISTSDSILTTDDLVEMTASGITGTLPTAVGVEGKRYDLKNSSTGSVTVDTTSSQTIDGATSVTVLTLNSLSVRSNGANWLIV